MELHLTDQYLIRCELFSKMENQYVNIEIYGPITTKNLKEEINVIRC